jgi:hypothetical protein
VTEVDQKLKRDLSYESSIKLKVRRASPSKMGAEKSPVKLNLDIVDNSQKDLESNITHKRNSARGRIFAKFMRSPYKLMDTKNQARMERQKHFHLSRVGINSKDES